MRDADNLGIVGKAGKVSNAGAVGRLWRREKCFIYNNFCTINDRG